MRVYALAAPAQHAATSEQLPRHPLINCADLGTEPRSVSHLFQVQPSSAFTNDLGLDSLDAVEVVMAIEEEFSIVSPPLYEQLGSAAAYSAYSACRVAYAVAPSM